MRPLPTLDTYLSHPIVRLEMSLSSSGEAVEGEPDPARLARLREFRSAGRGFWSDVPDQDWNSWVWQLKNRITTLEQLQRLMPTLTPEEYAGTKLANRRLALAITNCGTA